MKNNDQCFSSLAMNLSKQHGDYFRNNPLSAEKNDYFKNEAENSILKQKTIEASDTISFEQYLTNYYQQYNDIC